MLHQPPPPPSPPVGGFSFTSHLLYVICGNANSPVFISHASFPRKSLRKRLLEIVCYISWVFGEYPVAVIEYCGQDIVGKRQRSAFFDFEFHVLFSPETQTRNQRLTVRKLNLLFICKRKRNDVGRYSKFTICVYGFTVLCKIAQFFSAYFGKHQNPAGWQICKLEEGEKNGNWVKQIFFLETRRKPRNKITRNREASKVNHLTVWSLHRGVVLNLT